MTAPGQVITATPPAAPTALPAVPAPPTYTVASPTAPIKVIDGSLVPIIPPYVTAPFGGTGTLTAQFTASAVVSTSGTGLGVLSAAVVTVLPSAANFGGTGSSASPVAIAAGGAVVSASFATEGLLRPANAAFGVSAGLSAAVTANANVTALFYGVGTPFGIQPVKATAPFAAIGTASAVTGQIAQLSGSGGLSCPVTAGLAPAGMTKNGSWPTPTNGLYKQITGWSPDTTNYPGSNVANDGLVVASAKSGANISASIVFAGASFTSMNVTLQLAVNGNPVITGLPKNVPAASNTAVTVSGTATLNPNDNVTVQAVTDSSLQSATVNTNPASYVRIS